MAELRTDRMAGMFTGWALSIDHGPDRAHRSRRIESVAGPEPPQVAGTASADSQERIHIVRAGSHIADFINQGFCNPEGNSGTLGRGRAGHASMATAGMEGASGLNP